MRRFCALVSILISFCITPAQARAAETIEGYWQDIAGRTTFKRNASPASSYGGWNARELDATYPQAKRIQKSGTAFDLADLNYDEKEYSLKIVHTDAARIAFVRKANWSACRMEHDCRLDGSELFCSIQTVCQEAGKDVVDWRGEERYIRRTHCERDGRVQLLGFPVKCR